MQLVHTEEALNRIPNIKQLAIVTGTLANSLQIFDNILGKNTRNQYFINYFATSSLMIVSTFTHLWITKCVYETMHDICIC